MNYPNRDYIRSKDPKFAEALDAFAATFDNLMKNTNTGDSSTLPPPVINRLDVVAAQGVFDVAIQDNQSAVNRGINYFLEYSLTPAFSKPVVIDLGTSRNWRGFLGNRTLYFRAYSSYPTSPRSNPVYFGSINDPTPTLGGGTSVGPDPLPSSGSGTSTGGTGTDGGFGNQLTRKNNAT